MKRKHKVWVSRRQKRTDRRLIARMYIQELWIPVLKEGRPTEFGSYFQAVADTAKPTKSIPWVYVGSGLRL